MSAGRIASGVIGSIICGILYPVVHFLIFSFSFQGWWELALMILPGFVIGAVLGLMFPRLFRFIAEMILDV